MCSEFIWRPIDSGILHVFQIPSTINHEFPTPRFHIYSTGITNKINCDGNSKLECVFFSFAITLFLLHSAAIQFLLQTCAIFFADILRKKSDVNYINQVTVNFGLKVGTTNQVGRFHPATGQKKLKLFGKNRRRNGMHVVCWR